MSQNLITLARQKIGAFNINFLSNTQGCVLWLKADQLNLTNGQGVSSMQDQSVYGDNAFQSFGPYQPIFTTNSLNGLPTLSFTKESNQALIINNPANFNIVTPSIFLVGRWSSGTGCFFGKGKNAGVNDKAYRKLQLSNLSSGSNQITWWSGNDGDSLVKASATMTNWNIFSTIVSTEKSVNVNVNGVDNVSGLGADTHTFNTGNPTLGCGYDIGAEYLSGDIAEIIVLNFTAPDWLKRNIIDYLSTKWGIAVTNTVPPVLPSRAAAGVRTTA